MSSQINLLFVNIWRLIRILRGKAQRVTAAGRSAYSLSSLGADAEKRLDSIRPAQCQAFVRWLLGSVSKGTAGNHKSYISSAFQRAVDVDDYLSKNPMAGVNMAVKNGAEVFLFLMVL